MVLMLFLCTVSLWAMNWESKEDERYLDSCHPIYGPPDRDKIKDEDKY